jgi:tetratricopeptide (TPR) repeat protein
MSIEAVSNWGEQMRFASLAYVGLLTSCLNTHVRAEVPADCKSTLDRDTAIASCTKYLDRGGPNARDRAAAYAYRGQALSAKRRYEEAAADANRSVQADPSFYAGYLVRGVAYTRQGSFERALKDLNRAIELHPSSHTAFSARCLVRLYREEPDRAIADCNHALELDPKFAIGYNNRGVYFNNMKQYDRALADFSRAIEILPKYATSNCNRARTFVDIGQLDRATTDVARCLELDPQNPLAYRTRAEVHLKRGEQGRGLADLMHAIELDPVFVEAYVDRAEIYLNKKQWEPGVQDLRRALSLPARRLREREAQIRAAALLTSLRDKMETSKPNIPIPASTPPAPAASGLSGRRLALVIGNSAYTHVGILKNPAKDAKIIAAALKRSGFSEVIEHYDLGLPQMISALRDFGDRAQGADWAVIYFAGHGMEVGGVGYLIPTDAKLERDVHVADETIPLDRFLQKAEGARRLRLVILDACRNNPFAARMARSGSSARAIGRGLPALEPEGDVLVAYATKHGMTAMDGEGDNSPYALALAENIPAPNIDVRVMFGRVRDTVRKSTNSQQEPFTYGSIGGDLLFFVAAAR